MADFYSALSRKIQQVRDDPARVREVVYEAARLALRWQVAERGSLSKLGDSRRLKVELEEAIARLEAEAAGTAVSGADAAGETGAVIGAAGGALAEPGKPAAPQLALDPEKAAGRVAPEKLAGEPPVIGELEKSSAQAVGVAATETPDEPAKVPADLGAIRPGAPLDLDEVAAAKARPAQPGRDRVRAPRPRDPSRPAYRIKPSEFVNREQRRPPRSGPGMALFGIVIALQFVVAALAAAAFYVAMWGRGTPLMTAGEAPRSVRTAADTAAATAPEPPTLAAAPLVPGLATPPPALVAPPAPAAPSEAPAVSPAMPAAPSTTAPAPSSSPIAPAPRVVAALDASFQQPSSYGVYVVSDNKLVELQQARARPVDPRNAGQLQIVEPGRTVVAPGKPTFVIFLHDLASHAPEKVPLRIAARVAHAMNFDSTGKAIMTTPAIDTWIIRELGYDLRVSPIEGNSEMIKLQAEDPALSLPPGRYELMVGGQAYDFTVAGEVTDPAHCVEGVTTVRGQVFNECKPVL
jgi:hypothetical protein